MSTAPLHSEPDRPPPRRARAGRRYAAPLAVVVAGALAATIVAAVLLRVAFYIPFQQHQAIVSGHLLRALGQVEVMAAFRQSNAGMTGAEFDRFAAKLLSEESGLVALSWAPRVADGDRAVFEQQAAGDGLPGYQITDMTAEGRIRAESRPEYFPVRFGVPLQTAQPALGYDISMHPVRRAALMAARDSGSPSVTERIVLVNDVEGVIVLAPVYEGGDAPATVAERRRRFLGVIVGAMQFPDLLAGALTGDEVLIGLDTLLVDLDAQGPRRLLADLPSPRRNSYSGQMPREESPGRISAAVDLAVGDRTWRLIVAPAPISTANPFRAGPYVAGFAVLLVSLSLALVLWMRLNRMHEIEVRVRDRTGTLQQSEQRTRQITDTIPVLIAYTDARLRYRYVNGTMERWYALPGNRIVGEKVESVVGPEPFARVREHIDAVLAGREVSFAQSGRYPDGAFREVEANYLPDFDDRGNVQGYFTTVVDVTNWRRLEREIESFFSLNLGLMAIVSFDGAFSRVNPAWETSLGYSVEEFVGRSIQTLVHPEDEERFAAEFALLQAGEDKSHGFEVRFLHRNGDVRLLSWIAAPIVEQRIVLVTATDVTDQRRSEGELRAAQQRAAAAVQAKGMFLTNISHEIRTPLTSVVGFSEIVLQSDLTPKLRDQVRKIRTSGQVLLDLVDDILDLSKIDAGRLTLEEVPFRLSGMVEDAASLMGVRAAHKYIDLAFSIDPGVPDEVRGDPVRLSQVLVNLVGNALKFTDEGEVRVRVRVSERSSDTATLRFEVRDTGVGLGAGESGRLFDPFVQGDASTTRRFGGTGLGLAISRDIIRLMGGEIGAKQREGRGSQFWFSVNLPVLGAKTAVVAASLRVLVTGDDSASRDWAFAVLSGACG
ncbi:MAG: CHASE domain-containing protein, partial [Proteobacteria bacterium]|nr:CHASE domain-containing protein [Pseudomonadota bacterium]